MDAANNVPEAEEDEEEAILPYLFEKELIENQNKHVHIFDSFRGSKKMCPPVDSKFYAKHEQKLPQLAKHLIALTIPEDGRKHPDGFPRLESQMYGWLPKRDSGYGDELLQLNYVRAPKLRCKATIFGERLFSERHTERPAFNGARFCL